ncbi:Aste57867_15156 [Aphanomyces stellatus]|uniref:Aste57867_15156 protein n=1 Tax=Aphanomyces stellatus TaxID=120398 RepID=A0A485L4B0_9STRA|nr:hypothetical protein As57867_015100 [Aphanomyces stellatus]VFT91965.1 Aste57867_15156 [Aphanomyces stellatus]
MHFATASMRKKIDHQEPENEEIDETLLTLQRLLNTLNFQTNNSQTNNTAQSRPASEVERRRAEREAHRRDLYEGQDIPDRDRRRSNRAAERRIRSRVWSTTCLMPEFGSHDRWSCDDGDDDDDDARILHPAIIRASFRAPMYHPKLEVKMTNDVKLLKASLPPRAARAMSSCSSERMLKPPRSTWYLRGKNMDVQ